MQHVLGNTYIHTHGCTHGRTTSYHTTPYHMHVQTHVYQQTQRRAILLPRRERDTISTSQQKNAGDDVAHQDEGSGADRGLTLSQRNLTCAHTDGQ